MRRLKPLGAYLLSHSASWRVQRSNLVYMRGFLKGSVSWMKFSVFLVVLLVFFVRKRFIPLFLLISWNACPLQGALFLSSFLCWDCCREIFPIHQERMDEFRTRVSCCAFLIVSITAKCKRSGIQRKSYCEPEVSQIAHYYTKYALFWVQGVSFHRGVCEAVWQNWGKIRTNIWCCGRSG